MEKKNRNKNRHSKCAFFISCTHINFTFQIGVRQVFDDIIFILLRFRMVIAKKKLPYVVQDQKPQCNIPTYLLDTAYSLVEDLSAQSLISTIPIAFDFKL